VTSLYEIDRFIQDKKNKEAGLEDDEEELRRKVLTIVPPEYHEFQDVFSKVQSDTLPPFRPTIDHKIQLTEGAQPEDLEYSPMYKLSKNWRPASVLSRRTSARDLSRPVKPHGQHPSSSFASMTAVYDFAWITVSSTPSLGRTDTPSL
jgi:hypothetical protein